MIQSFYLKDYLSFKEVNLELSKGLNIFTGPSGAGKSIFMQAILSNFAFFDVKSSISEIILSNSNMEINDYNISKNDEISLKTIKKDKVRYFLNSQSISKNSISLLSEKLIKYINSKKNDEFLSANLIFFLDDVISLKQSEYIDILSEFKTNYEEYRKSKKELALIIEDEKKIEDLKEFAKFEIDKIESINPKVDEYEELIDIKSKLSKKEKIEENIQKASRIFQFTHDVNTLLEMLDEDSSFFDDSINELNNIIEKSKDNLYELEEVDIEQVLDRIEKLVALTKRFGSIQEAIDYKENKKNELRKYENISFEKKQIENKILKLEGILNTSSKKISEYRRKYIIFIENRINYYLEYLYLENVKFLINDIDLISTGIDEIQLKLNNTNIKNISSGEFNRLKLALLCTMSECKIVENGILFLDEIDANLSGKESESIAKLLKLLSSTYQIFAISHQPQLTSLADSHYLVEKVDKNSEIILLNKEERVNEIARMISGKNITIDAINFAKNILNDKKLL